MESSHANVVLRDTTLREGVQIPGSHIPMSLKCRFVQRLDQAGVPEIEIGLPEGITACSELADVIGQRGLSIRPTALVPCYIARWKQQVDLAAEHGIRRIDILAPVSDHLLRDWSQYGLGLEQIAPRLSEMIAYARRRRLALGVGLIDACRAPVARVVEVAAPLAGQGVSRLVVYDSVGTMLPWRMHSLVGELRRRCALPLLVHCHNDYGLAAANSLAAIEAGAVGADVAVNGLGGRAGNAALEEVALALENLCGRTTAIDTTRFGELSALADEMTALPTWPLKPVVGRFCFAHVPVMHIRCIAGGNPRAFEPFEPAQVGLERTYDFALPVDYATALEPFLRRSGCRVAPAEIPPLVAALRRASDGRGLTDRQVLDCMRQFEVSRDHDSAGPSAIRA